MPVAQLMRIGFIHLTIFLIAVYFTSWWTLGFSTSFATLIGILVVSLGFTVLAFFAAQAIGWRER